MRRLCKTEKGKRVIWKEGAFRRCFYLGRNELTFVGQNDRHYKLKKNLGLYSKEKPNAHVNGLNGPPLEYQTGSNWILHDLV